MTAFNLDFLIRKLQILVKNYESGLLNSFNARHQPKKSTDINTISDNYNIKQSMFRIGDIVVKNPVVSAPLAGISDNTYRIFAKAFGSALNYTEMISSYGLYYRHKKSISLADITEFERPCGIQIFGSEPTIMLEAALMVEKHADFIDINMGCPVPKVLKTKGGGYLLKDEKRIADIISNLVSKVKKPVTVKLRIGWDRDSINVKKIAKIAEFNGASAVAIHGRTVKQGFSGRVDYSIIEKVKEKLNIPVIVSGGIYSFKAARDILDLSGCDAVMIGRASRGNPWIFFNIATGLANLRSKKKDMEINNILDFFDNFNPPLDFKKDLASLYLGFMVYFKGEKKAVMEFRKCISWIFRNVRGVSRLREGFISMNSIEDVMNQINNI